MLARGWNVTTRSINRRLWLSLVGVIVTLLLVPLPATATNWIKQIGTSTLSLTACLQHSDGSFYIVGTTNNSPTIPVFIARLDADGNLYWKKDFGTNANQAFSVSYTVETTDHNVEVG